MSLPCVHKKGAADVLSNVLVVSPHADYILFSDVRENTDYMPTWEWVHEDTVCLDRLYALEACAAWSRL